VGSWAYSYTTTGRAATTTTATVTRMPNGTWQLTLRDSVGAGADQTFEMRSDGLYITGAVAYNGTGSRAACRLPSPAPLYIPNPLVPGRHWTLILSCPTFDVRGDFERTQVDNTVSGFETIAVGGQSVRVARIDASSTTQGPFSQRGHETVYLDPDLGLPVKHVSDSSGVVNAHSEETLLALTPTGASAKPQP